MIMRQTRLFALIGISFTMILFASCKKKNVDAPNEEELITTVKVTLTPIGGGVPVVAEWKDLDGPGGALPVIGNISLDPGKSYNCALDFLDETKSPVDEITDEIVSEGTDHQIYYEATGVNLTINGLDTDTGDLPLGTTSVWTTGAAGTGSLKIILKHKPGTKAAGDLVTKGETDVSVDLPVVIQPIIL